MKLWDVESWEITIAASRACNILSPTSIRRSNVDRPTRNPWPDLRLYVRTTRGLDPNPLPVFCASSGAPLRYVLIGLIMIIPHAEC